MNLKQVVTLELVRENLTFSLHIPANVTYELAKEVCQEFQQALDVAQKQFEARKAAEQSQPQQ